MTAGLRQQALQKLEDFLTHGAKDYGKKRNYDFGASNRSNVSELSRFIQTRLLLEEEVVQKVLAKFSFSEVDKYIQEVMWRTYWKGWLEMRPQVWSSYLTNLDRQLQDEKLLSKRDELLSGRSDLECFNDWAAELKQTGYLHNHARMWFASLWCHRYQMPWELGADFFYRHLLDGDAASNTLSWRWVAGLQTPGKTYIASGSNIKKFTNARYSPSEVLIENTLSFSEDVSKEPKELPEVFSFDDLELKNTAVWLHPEDLMAYDFFENNSKEIKFIFSFGHNDVFKKMRWDSKRIEFLNSATASTLQAGGNRLHCEHYFLDNREELERLCKENQIQQIAYLKPFVGPWRMLEKKLPQPAYPLRREWDQKYFPFAKKGFFKFWTQIKDEVAEL